MNLRTYNNLPTEKILSISFPTIWTHSVFLSEERVIIFWMMF